MIRDKKVLALILARGGSKGIPKKNILDFCGIPLVGLSVIQAKTSSFVDETYVSSDSNEILDIAKYFGASVIRRPANISDDHSKSEEAVLHALETINEKFDIVLMLEPTAPLRKPNDINDAIKYFINHSLDSLFSGAKLEDFILWRKDKNENLYGLNHDPYNQMPRQMREPDYLENGAIYLFKSEEFKKNKNRFFGKIGHIEHDIWQSFEIDQPDDWGLVSTLFKQFILKNNEIGKIYEKANS